MCKRDEVRVREEEKKLSTPQPHNNCNVLIKAVRVNETKMKREET